MSFLRARFCPVFLATLSISLCASHALAVEPYIASVTATEVNVRSGPSTNYYIVTKLKAGDRVEVREEDAGWFGIVPPPGCFSLISKHYVDLDGKGGGVVNGNNVRVRAGSNYSPSRYAVQVKLHEGDEVEVLEDGPEGFLKIKSPKGAYAWIHGELVARSSEQWVDSAKFESKPVASSATTSNPPPAISTASTSKPPVAVADVKPKSITESSPRMSEATPPSSTQSSSDAAIRPNRQSAASTDRVAVYTWSEESGGKIKRTDSNALATKSGATTTTTSQGMSISDDKVANVGVQPSITTTKPADREEVTSTTSTQSMTSNSGMATTPNMSSTTTPQPTSRGTPFSSDSTGQVAVIKWDDAKQTTTTSTMSRPQPTVATNQPSTATPSPNTQALSGTQGMTSEPMYVQPNSSSTTSSQSITQMTSTTTVSPPVQSTTSMVVTSAPVEPTAPTVIPYTGVDPRAELKLIDDEMMRELDKPLEQRQFGELMAKYRGVMQANVDEASRLYAERRLHQLEVLAIRINAVGQINNLVSEVVETRHTASQQRATFTTTSVERPSVGYAAVGELRESLVFSSPVGPRRYRLIDPNDAVPRTLCYVEIPRDSAIDVSQYLGRIVGVRSSRDYVETGNVDPISVLVASSIEPVSGNVSASVSTSTSQSVAPAPGITYPEDSSSTDQIAIRPMVPTYNP